MLNYRPTLNVRLPYILIMVTEVSKVPVQRVKYFISHSAQMEFANLCNFHLLMSVPHLPYPHLP